MRNIQNIVIIFVILGIIGFIAYDQFGNSLNQKTNIKSDENVREIQVIAKQFAFSPDPIRVKLNEKVRFRVTSPDVAHGMSIPDFGFNMNIAPDQEAVAEFQANKKGEFSIQCSVFCGNGHAGMAGKLIVE